MKRAASALTLISALLMLAVAGTHSVHAATDCWVSKAPMHEARGGVGVAVVNGKIYAIGGASPSGKRGFSVTNEEYDPATDTWTFKASMPTPRSDFGITVYQNKIYCIGGYTDGFTATAVNEVYDIATDTWETKAPMPTPRLNLKANVVNGKIYLIGGIEYSNRTQTGVSNLTEVYDPATDTWTTKAPMLEAFDFYSSAVVDNKIYVITSKLNQIYSAESDNWSLGAPLPSSMVYPSAGATTGANAPKRIYVFGADADIPYWQLTLRKFTTQSYNPKTNSWTVCASMPTGRFGTGVAVVNDKLYVIGGYTIVAAKSPSLFPSINFSAVNEQYTPNGYGTPDPSYAPPADSAAPEITVLSPQNKTCYTLSVPLNFTVNEPCCWMRYKLDAETVGEISGNTSLTGLAYGAHTLTVYATDAAGNTEASETIYFSVAETPEPFPTALVATTLALVAVVGVGLTVYFKKRNYSTNIRLDCGNAVA